MLKNKIKKLTEVYYPQLIAIRRFLHTNPELSFQEKNTSHFLKEKFNQLHIPYKEYAGTGVVGILQFNDPSSKVVALRADMDALPVFEENEVPYKSITSGVMHACGHDVHMTCLLGAIFILNELKGELNGTLKIIFQPAEEKLPGGAKQMIEEGVLNDPEPSVVIAQHVYPDLPSGTCGFYPGFYMSSSDELYIKISGKGGHAALYKNTINPIYISSSIINKLHSYAEQLNMDSPGIISIGKIEAHGATNIIPESVYIEGTVRSFNEQLRKKMHEKIMEIVYDEAEQKGGKAELEIRCGYPTLYNDPGLTEKLASYASYYLGKEQVHQLAPRMTSEDFAYFALKKPSVLFRLGVSDPSKDQILPLHSSKFDIHEEALKTGAGLMAYLAYRELINA